jgi:hypothetical protein
MCCSPRAICKQQLLCLFLFFVCSSHSSRVCSLCSLFDQHVSRRLLEHLPSELHYATDQERHAWFSRRLRPSAQGKLVSGPMALDTVWSGRARRSSRYPANRARLGRRRELDARRRPKKLPRAARRSRLRARAGEGRRCSRGVCHRRSRDDPARCAARRSADGGQAAGDALKKEPPRRPTPYGFSSAPPPPPPFSTPSGPRASIFSFSRHFGFCLCMLPPLSGRAPPPTQEK